MSAILTALVDFFLSGYLCVCFNLLSPGCKYCKIISVPAPEHLVTIITTFGLGSF